MVNIVFNGKGWTWFLYEDKGDVESLISWSDKSFRDRAECMFDYVCKRLEDLSKRVQDLEGAKANG